MRICIYEDRRTVGLGPLTLTRPAADLLCGLSNLGEKQVRFFGAEAVGYLCRPVLAELLRARDPQTPVNDPAWLRSAPTVLVNGRWLPPIAFPRIAPRELLSNGAVLGVCNGEVAYAVLEPSQLQATSPATVDDCLQDWLQSLPTREAGGSLIRYPWDLIEQNPTEIAREFEMLSDPAAAGFHPTTLSLVGPASRLLIHPTAKIDPMVVADTTNGPVWIGPGAIVTAFTRLEGPCVVGAGTHVLGAKIRAGTTLGPNCRIGGEVECSIVQGFSNKYHDGFLGHSFVGEWVNLAAGTITGDLRFDYQPISVMINGEVTSTGQIKVGSFFGDHARTGLGVLLDCGTVIGAFASVLPTGRLAPREVPSFSRSGPDGLRPASDHSRLLAAADTAMRRRGRELTPQLETVYRSITATATPTTWERQLRRCA